MKKKSLKIMGSIIFIILTLVSCTPKQDYKTQLQDVKKKWDDAIKIADTTARIALSQPVARLQEIKQESEKIAVSKRMKECHEHLIKYMDSTIDGFLGFMADNLEAAKEGFKESKDELTKWLLCSLPDKEARQLSERINKEEDDFIKKEEEEMEKEEKIKKEGEEGSRLSEEIKNNNNTANSIYILEGIFFDANEKSSVIINGKVVFEGDTVGNAKIYKINEDSVEIEVNGEKKNIKVGQK